MAAAKSRDYVAIAINYAKGAISDRYHKRHGKWLRLAARRFLDDLKRAKRKRSKFFFDEWHANDACDFLEKLPHVEGRWETPTIVLHPAQIFFVVQLFGFRSRNTIEIDGWGDDGKFYPRRFTSALFAVARKNGKALALDTPIPSPNGWTTMGALRVGDIVYGGLWAGRVSRRRARIYLRRTRHTFYLGRI